MRMTIKKDDKDRKSGRGGKKEANVKKMAKDEEEDGG